MKKIVLLLFLITSFTQAQEDLDFNDKRYLEDQLYAKIAYLKILNTPKEITQTGFSYGLGLGFIKDLPLNKKRNIAFGIGLGYGFNNYYFSVKDITIPEDDPVELKSNKVTTHSIDLPIEFRFRTSTSKKYKFWRVYPGFKFSYVFADNSRLKQREDFNLKELIQINNFLYGATLSAGYNKWNLFVYYGLNDIFTNTDQNAYKININDLRLGLIFYIL